MILGGCTDGGDDPTRDEAADEADGITDLFKSDPEEPYPYNGRVPPQEPTPIDGEYFRTVTIKAAGGKPVACRRCAPYRVEAGTTSFSLAQGRFHVVHEGPGDGDAGDFRSVSHFEVAGDRIEIFNDANCPQVEAVYTWRLSGGLLVFEPLDTDPCWNGLREEWFTSIPFSEDR